ncbi:YceI family protein [Streptomyces sp. NPDC051940]|uniref:YceI family protein n=1 Tax=Streptomyces sp. NPDC051940 TaxID=3155675 RepID=UPI0034134ADA
MIGLRRGRRDGRRMRTTNGLAGVQVPPQAGLLSCRVLDPVGDPLPAAELTVTDPVGRKVVAGESDPYGLFVAAVPPGEYRVAVESEGLTPYRGETQVTEGAGTHIGDVSLPPAQLPQLPPPGDWEIDPAHTTIGFTARHIGMARVRGRFNNYTGALRIGRRMEESQLHVVMEAASIDTNIKMRDDHLRSADFLDVERFPTLEFYSDRFTHRVGNRWAVSGALSIHGVSRTVTLDTEYLGIGVGMEGELRAACRATTELHREDFTLNWQHMLARGIAVVGSSIKIELDIQVVGKG